MVHQRQRLPLGLEPGDDLLGVHAQLDDLERHPAAHRLLLLGHVDHAAAALADLLQQLVAANPVAGLSHERVRHRESNGGLKKRAGLVVRGKQRIRLPAQCGIAPASPFQKRRPLQRRQIARGAEDLFETVFLVG